MRISDWSSDVCSSDLAYRHAERRRRLALAGAGVDDDQPLFDRLRRDLLRLRRLDLLHLRPVLGVAPRLHQKRARSEEHTSELQSLMRISYAVFCLKKKHKYHIQPLSKHTHKTQTTN